MADGSPPQSPPSPSSLPRPALSRTFLAACRAGDEERVRSTLASWPGVLGAVDGQLWGGLHWLAHLGALDSPTPPSLAPILRLLLAQEGVQPILMRGDGHGRTAAHVAARAGHSETLKAVLEVAPLLVAQVNALGQTPLVKAVQYQHTEVVALLMVRGAPVNTLDKEHGHTYSPPRPPSSPDPARVLHLAAQRSLEGALTILLRTPAVPPLDLAALDAHGQTPLHVAVTALVRSKEEGSEGAGARCLRVLLSLPGSSLAALSLGRALLHWTEAGPSSSSPSGLPLTLLPTTNPLYPLLRDRSLLAWTQSPLAVLPPPAWDEGALTLWASLHLTPPLPPALLTLLRRHHVTGRLLSSPPDQLLRDLAPPPALRPHLLRLIAALPSAPPSPTPTPLQGPSSAPGGLGQQWFIPAPQLVPGEVVGRGYFGEVRKGTWRGTLVALKALHRTGTGGGREQTRFAQEVALLSALRHPNVVAFLGWSLGGAGELLLVLEYLGGGTLHRLATEHAAYLDAQPSLLRSLAQDVARGMAYLHARHVLHRDLNAHNILLDEHLTAHIADFGLARLVGGGDEEEEGWGGAGAEALTQHVGFLPFMAPEVFRGERYAWPADVYAYAMILYTLLLHGPPHGRLTAQTDLLAFAYQAAHAHARPPLPPTLPPTWTHLLEVCWHPEPSHRPTFAQLLESLAPPSGGGGGGGTLEMPQHEYIS